VRRAIFLASVETDLVEIFTTLAEASGSLSLARGYVRRLRDHCHYLAGLPGQMGRARPELMETIRSAAFGNYVIFFRYNHSRFEVVNILYGRRDIEAFFSDDG
jgi:toxin ParE1/3/4